MKHYLCIAVLCAAMVCVLAGCEPREVRLTPAEVIERYFPYEEGDEVTFRSESGKVMTMRAMRPEKEYNYADTVFEMTTALVYESRNGQGEDEAEFAVVNIEARIDRNDVMFDVTYVEAMQDCYYSYYLELKEGENVYDAINNLSSVLTSHYGDAMFYGENGGESSHEGYREDVSCTFDIWNGIVEFETYDEVWEKEMQYYPPD